ncbi:MAG: hypothetical protein P1U75_04810 [Antarcticimicrobium sp.]|nr:oligopeptide/dipeptide ABC transporter ATP-binding protein [Antarcticimicrobium sp.]MDF1715985.1 hypothetical protein [Antarcticimicrobium sp.]
MPTMEGSAPSMRNLPDGCPFRPRCAQAMETCKSEPPVRTGTRRMVRCWLYE